MGHLELLLEDQKSLPEPSSDSQMYQFVSRKSNWVPATYAHQVINPNPRGYDKAVLKSLALALALEIPVGEYTLEASKSEFTQDERWALLDNAADEITHFTALHRLAHSLSPDNKELLNEYSKEALNFAKEIELCPENTIVKSGYIELGAFLVILSLLRRFGLPSMKILVGNISKDESVHVQTNWFIIDNHNIPYTDSKLNSIRRQIIDWVTNDIESNKWNTAFWLEQSDRLIETRRADSLGFTKSSISVAFFEVDNRSLAAY
jgi:hypothetical protein